MVYVCILSGCSGPGSAAPVGRSNDTGLIRYRHIGSQWKPYDEIFIVDSEYRGVGFVHNHPVAVVILDLESKLEKNTHGKL